MLNFDKVKKVDPEVWETIYNEYKITTGIIALKIAVLLICTYKIQIEGTIKAKYLNTAVNGIL